MKIIRINHHKCSGRRCTNDVENKGDLCETCRLTEKIQLIRSERPEKRYNPLER